MPSQERHQAISERDWTGPGSREFDLMKLRVQLPDPFSESLEYRTLFTRAHIRRFEFLWRTQYQLRSEDDPPISDRPTP